MAKDANSLKIKPTSKAKKAWLNKTARSRYDVAYDYLTDKQKRMIMQDLPRKLLQETIRNPYGGSGIKGGSNKVGPVKL
tara:strand:- start:53 stop:289 length:237 start_codon:yes stop_codon:yes gene_type:complete